ncbi:XRE family transcriptional regulator, partial [Kitasatospora sp. NPDC006697]
ATLIADALMKLGRIHHAHRWYGTARTAADDSGNFELRARVRAQAAMLPYYYGPLDAAIDLARQARLLNRNRPTATGALASAAEARALARRGDATGALAAITHTQELFARCQPGPAYDAWAFPERRLFLYLSGAYTYLGDTARARAIQQQALALYPDRTGIDPALLNLEEAICLAREHSLAEACQLAGRTYLRVPPAHRTDILGSRAQDVIRILPTSLRTARAVRELDEILALPAASK